MGWQDIVVGIVIVLCLVKMLMSIFGKSGDKGGGDGICAHCTSPCDIKRLYDRKRDACENKEKKTDGSCCS